MGALSKRTDNLDTLVGQLENNLDILVGRLETFGGAIGVIFIVIIALVVIQWKNQAILLKDLEYLKAKVAKLEKVDIQDVETTELSKSDTLLT